MRILFEVLLLVVIALFAYKAFGWLFPEKKNKGQTESREGEQEVKKIYEGDDLIIK